jgi:peroxiredoxin
VGGGYRGLRDLVEPGGGIVTFFKGDCPASLLVVPRLHALARALARDGLLLLAIAQEDEATARAIREEHGLSFPVAYETAPHHASRAYGVTVVPTLFVIDGAGRIAERVEGFVKAEYLGLGAAIEQALALGDKPPILERAEELPELKPG